MHPAVEAIQLPQQIQLLAMLPRVQKRRRLDVRHRRISGRDVRQRGLVVTGEESGIVKRAPAVGPSVRHHHESRHVPVFRPQPVGHPGTETGVALPGIARVHEDLAGAVDRHIGIHRFDECDVVDHLRQVREDFADPSAALAIALEREHRRNDLRGVERLRRIQAVQILFGEDVLGLFSAVLFQQRLVIERLDLACATDHEQKDDVPRLGSEVWLPGSEWIAEINRRHGPCAARLLVRDQAGQRDTAQAEFLEKPTAVRANRSSSAGCVSEHR